MECWQQAGWAGVLGWKWLVRMGQVREGEVGRPWGAPGPRARESPAQSRYCQAGPEKQPRGTWGGEPGGQGWLRSQAQNSVPWCRAAAPRAEGKFSLLTAQV